MSRISQSVRDQNYLQFLRVSTIKAVSVAYKNVTRAGSKI